MMMIAFITVRSSLVPLIEGLCPAESSAGGSVAAAAPMSFSPGAIEGLTFVSAAGAAQFTGAALARGGRDAELQSKGKHGGNSLRLEAGHCHQLSNPAQALVTFLT